MMALMQVDPAQNFSGIYLVLLFCYIYWFYCRRHCRQYIYSRINPVTVLKGSGNLKIFKRLTFRKILLVTQYFFSIVFIITIILIYSQMIFMVNADMGFDSVIRFTILNTGTVTKAVMKDMLGKSP